METGKLSRVQKFNTIFGEPREKLNLPQNYINNNEGVNESIYIADVFHIIYNQIM